MVNYLIQVSEYDWSDIEPVEQYFARNILNLKYPKEYNDLQQYL